MKLRKLALAAALVVGFAPAAQASIWDWNFTDIGVDYSLSFDSLVGNVGTFSLTLDTSGYNHHADPAFLNVVDIKAWNGQYDSWSLLSAPTGVANWTEHTGSSSANGCGDSPASFACAQAVNVGVHNVDNGPYSFQFAVTADSFIMDRAGVHVGAGYADALGNGPSYGLTSQVAPPIPEPETYAMMLAGLGLLGFVARRRRQTLGNLVPA